MFDGVGLAVADNNLGFTLNDRLDQIIATAANCLRQTRLPGIRQ